MPCGESEPSMPCGDSPAKYEGRQFAIRFAGGRSQRTLPQITHTNNELEGPFAEKRSWIPAGR